MLQIARTLPGPPGLTKILDMVGWRDNYPGNHTGAKGFLSLQYSMKKNSLVAAESSVTSSCVGDHT